MNLHVIYATPYCTRWQNNPVQQTITRLITTGILYIEHKNYQC